MTTQKKGFRVAKDVKEQILKRVREEGIPVAQAADEHGVSDKTIYTWLTKGASGNPCGVKSQNSNKRTNHCLSW